MHLMLESDGTANSRPRPGVVNPDQLRNLIACASNVYTAGVWGQRAPNGCRQQECESPTCIHAVYTLCTHQQEVIVVDDGEPLKWNLSAENGVLWTMTRKWHFLQI